MGPKGTSGIGATVRATGEKFSQNEICRMIASEILGETNRVKSNDNAQVSYRMRKGDRTAILNKIEGMRTALTFALGQPLGCHEIIDDYLEDFRKERLASSKNPPPSRTPHPESVPPAETALLQALGGAGYSGGAACELIDDLKKELGVKDDSK